MRKTDFQEWMEKTFKNHILETSKAGQKEYAHSTDDAFDNFKRSGAELGIDPKQCLMVYANKHRDGIHAYLKGHKSQREPVQGRIKDSIVYLFLLWAMIDEEEQGKINQIVSDKVKGVDIFNSQKMGDPADRMIAQTPTQPLQFQEVLSRYKNP